MRRLWMLTGLAIFGLSSPQGVEAQPVPRLDVTRNPSPPPGFADRPSVLLTQRLRQMFEDIRQACEHSRGQRDWTAVEWLFTTAQDHGWEADLDRLTQQVSRPDPENPSLSKQAQAVRIVGLAQLGKAEEAIDGFETALKGVRLRQPQEMLTLAQTTSLAFQLRGDLDAARTVYERVSEAFALNPEVRDFVAHRLQRLKLVGKPAPEITLADLNGEPIRWSDYRGKVVVVDFWATNCRPCLDELPRLRRFHHDRDVECVDLIGISLDQTDTDILQFRRQEPLAWRIALDQKMATEAFQVVLIPCLIALDSTGNVAAVDIPPRRLAATVHQLLSPPATK